MNYEEWYEGLVAWLSKNAVPQGTPEHNNGWSCKDCGVDLHGEGKTASLHYRGTLAGPGEVKHLVEPSCPNCGKRYPAPPFLDY